jgi:thioredoxin 1
MELAVNDTNFDEIVLSSDKPVVVDFWAEWCGPCKMIGPYIEQMAEEFKDKAVVVKCDVDSSPAVAKKYMIRNIPTVLYFKNGEIADKQVGAAAKSVFVAKLTPLL